jgi:agmatine deiminase
MHDIDFMLEGGSIETDGLGTLLTTTQCLLNPNRNPGYTKNQIVDKLSQTLGIERVLWLEHGYLAGDDTDSHIDTLARFSNNNQIVYMSCEEDKDEHYTALKNMHKQLQQFRSKDNMPYELIAIEIPPPIHHPEGYRLPASYVNYLVINGAVLVPTYRSPESDDKAVATLSNIFHDRQIVTIDCYPMIMQHGSLHCATMQLHGQQCDPANKQ